MMVLDKEDGRWQAGVPTPPTPSPRRTGCHAPGLRDIDAGPRRVVEPAGGPGREDGPGCGGRAPGLAPPRSPGLRTGGRGKARRFAAGRRGGSECPLVSAPWRLALSVWSLRLLLAHRSHHPCARRVTREALSAQQISSFREKGTG